MRFHNRNRSEGFTLLEILIVLTLIGIVSVGVYSFTVTSGVNYLRMHEDGLRFSELSEKSQRISRVLRGGGDITEATNDAITIYAYFSPADQYYSLIRYYKDPTNTKIMADVTPMTSNPPIGTPITAQKVTYTILDDFYNDPASKTFEYLDSAGGVMALPIADNHTIKGLRVNLVTASPRSPATTKTAISTDVSLRNRKTNL